MSKHLKQEFYHLSRSWLILLVLLALLVGNAVMSARDVIGERCCWLNILAAGFDHVLFIPFPAWLHGLRNLWQPGASPLWLIASALVSLAYILVFGWLSVRRFERSEM